jgi:Fic family protein
VTRKQEQYLRIIYNIAFLRQHSREKKKETDRYGNEFTYIEVMKEDIETANEIASHVFRFARGDLSKRLYDANKRIEEYCAGQVKKKRIGLYEQKFSRREIREYGGWDPATTKRLFDELEDLEYIRKVSGGTQGTRYLYRLVSFHERGSGDSDLRLLDPDNL